MSKYQQISVLYVHGQCKTLKRIQASGSVSQWSVVICAISLHMDSTDSLAMLSSSRSLLLLTVRATIVAPTSGLQQAVVGQWHCLIQQCVQSLFIYTSFRKLHLRKEQK